MAKATAGVQRGSKAPAAEAAGDVASDLLDWYDGHRRTLPWRAAPGERGDPYAIWLSEIMLQQTTVAAVRAYYARFLERWPNVAALAAAPLGTVLQAWAGLGYYSRARNLHGCARRIVEHHEGRFPESEKELRQLPGIGDYTAAAITAIAFGHRAVVVDGNVERVMARLHAIALPMPAAKGEVRRAMDAATPPTRAGDFAQAVMDLGATICTPKSPACVICPIRSHCAAARGGDPAAYPVRLARKPVPHRQGAVFVVRRDDGAILVQNRPAEGLFGGMAELPGTPWGEDFDLDDVSLPDGLTGPLEPIGTVEHGLTHFSLTLHVFKAKSETDQLSVRRWVPPHSLSGEAFPTLMRKVLICADLL